MLRRVDLVRTNVSEELSASFIKATIFRSVLRLPVTAKVVHRSPILITLMIEAIYFSEISVLTRAAESKISEEFFRIPNVPLGGPYLLMVA
jgi:hypothetical protein